MNPGISDQQPKWVRSSPAVGGMFHLLVLSAALAYMAWNGFSLYRLLFDPLPSPRSEEVKTGLDLLYSTLLEEIDKQRSDTQTSPTAAAKRVETLLKIYETSMPDLHLSAEGMGNVRTALSTASQYLSLASLAGWELRRMTRDDNVRGLEAEARANLIMAISEIRGAMSTVDAPTWELVRIERDQRVGHIAFNLGFGVLTVGLLIFLFMDRQYKEAEAIENIQANAAQYQPPWAVGAPPKAKPGDMVINLDETMVMRTPQTSTEDKEQEPEAEDAKPTPVEEKPGPKLVQVDAAKLLAGAAARSFQHDLTVINGYSDLLLDALPSEDPVRMDVLAIRRAGERANVLAGQLQSFADPKPERWEQIEINRWLEGARPRLEALLSSDIRLDVELEPGAGIVRCDPDRMEQALKSLVLNASDAMPAGGRIAIRTSVHENAKNEFWTAVTVTDSGRGIDNPTLRSLFEPGHSGMPGRNAGIGLPSVASILEQHQGHVEVESQPGKGSSFHLLLPRAASVKARAFVRR